MFESSNIISLNAPINLFILSPLDQFEVTSLISITAPVFGYLNFTLSNLGLFTLLLFAILIGLHYLGNNDTKIIPSKWSIGLESLFTTINTMVREQLGKEIYLPFIYSLFVFILIANLLGNIPYSFSITTSVVITIGFSFTIVLGVTILSLFKHKIKFFSFFVPAGTPLLLVPLLTLIETISFLARAFSLGLRLFANITAGHTLLKILATFMYQLFNTGILVFLLSLVPFALFLGICGLEIAVSVIQSYVLTLLTISYIKDAIELH